MTRNQKIAMAENHIQTIYDELKKEFANIKILGVTEEEKKITKKVHAIMWLSALKQKQKDHKEADEFIRTIIISNSMMVDLGIIDEHAELVRKH